MPFHWACRTPNERLFLALLSPRKWPDLSPQSGPCRPRPLKGVSRAVTPIWGIGRADERLFQNN
jgi:hypothetical protein